jgi:hypothetical protein
MTVSVKQDKEGKKNLLEIQEIKKAGKRHQENR